MSNQNPHTVCVIGGGMSGLFTGALLAKNGYKVTVLEKNHIIGGGLQSFRRGDAVFNTGMQVFCGYEKPFMLGYLFNYLNIFPQAVHIIPTDSSAQEIIWTDSGHCYRLPKSRDKYEKYLITCFPHEKNGIVTLMDDIYMIGKTFDYSLLQKRKNHPEAIPYYLMSARELIQKHISDNELINLFEYIGMHSGYNLSNIPAIDICLLLNLYIEGSWRIAGGNFSLAQALANVVTSYGGKILNNAHVHKVHVQDKKIMYVETKSGERYISDIFISSVAPKLLLKMVDGEIFRTSTKHRVDAFKNDSSGCLLSIRLKPQCIKYQPHLFFFPAPKKDKTLPLYISLLTPARTEQDEWADTMEVLAFNHYENFNKWENSFVGQRGDEYELYKQEIANRLIDYVSQYYPTIKDAVDTVFVATPLTLRDYYGNIDGAVYAQQGVFIPIRTKANNLFITGQAVQYQGLFGVATTSIIVAETILGKSLIEEIAKA